MSEFGNSWMKILREHIFVYGYRKDQSRNYKKYCKKYKAFNINAHGLQSNPDISDSTISVF